MQRRYFVAPDGPVHDPLDGKQPDACRAEAEGVVQVLEERVCLHRNHAAVDGNPGAALAFREADSPCPAPNRITAPGHRLDPILDPFVQVIGDIELPLELSGWHRRVGGNQFDQWLAGPGSLNWFASCSLRHSLAKMSLGRKHVRGPYRELLLHPVGIVLFGRSRRDMGHCELRECRE